MQIQLTRAQAHAINPLIGEASAARSIENCAELVELCDELICMHSDKQGHVLDLLRIAACTLNFEHGQFVRKAAND